MHFKERQVKDFEANAKKNNNVTMQKLCQDWSKMKKIIDHNLTVEVVPEVLCQAINKGHDCICDVCVKIRELI